MGTPSRKADSSARPQPTYTAVELWERNPLSVFAHLRHTTTVALRTVLDIIEAASHAPHLSIVEVLPERHNALRAAANKAYLLLNNTPASRALAQPAPVRFDDGSAQPADQLCGSSWHDLAVGLAFAVVNLIEDDIRADRFVNAFEKCAGGDGSTAFDLLDAQPAGADPDQPAVTVVVGISPSRQTVTARVIKLLKEVECEAVAAIEKAKAGSPKGAVSVVDTGTKTARAIALKNQHPEWTDKQVADAVGCDPSTLSGSPEYKAARDAIPTKGAMRLQRARRRRGAGMDEYEDSRDN